MSLHTATMAIMDGLQWFAGVLGADRYEAHAKCLEHDPVMMMLYVAGNLMNWLAYLIVGSVLYTKRAQIVHLTPDAFRMFSAFLLVGSLEYVTQTLTVFLAVYRLDVVILMFTGAISCVVAGFTVMAVYGVD